MGRKTIFLAWILLAYLGCARPPELLLGNPHHDFGRVYYGEIAQHEFTFTNTGDEDLVIKSIQASCGCTIAKLWVEQTSGISRSGDPGNVNEVLRVYPGERGKIQISVNTAQGEAHALRKGFVYITTNQQIGNMELSYVMEVYKPYELQPPRINFGSLHKKASATFELQLTYTEKPFAITQVISTDVAVQGMWDPQANKIKITIGPNFPKLGAFHGELQLYTDLPNGHVISIPIFGFVLGNLTLTPEAFRFMRLQHAEKAVATVEVRYNHPAKTLRLENIQVLGDESENLTVEIKEIEPGKLFQLSMHANEKTKSVVFRGNVLIDTNDPDQAKLTIPYRGLISSSPKR